MSLNSEKLLAFAEAKAPECADLLPRSAGRLPAQLKGSNTEFLLRLVLEGLNILHQGDTQLQSFRFDKSHIDSFYKGYQILLNVVESRLPKEEEKQNLINVPKALIAISTYYEDKILALTKACANERKVIPLIQQEFQQMIQRRDYAGLWLEYSDLADLLDLDDEDLDQPAGTVSLEAQNRKNNMRMIFEEVVNEAARSGDNLLWGRPPQAQQFAEQDLELCTKSLERNKPLLEAVRKYANDFAFALDMKPPYLAPVVPFPARSAREPQTA